MCPNVDFDFLTERAQLMEVNTSAHLHSVAMRPNVDFDFLAERAKLMEVNILVHNHSVPMHPNVDFANYTEVGGQLGYSQ